MINSTFQPDQVPNLEFTVSQFNMLELCFILIPHCTHTHPFSGPLSGTTQVSRYQKGKTNQDFTEASDSE